MKMQPRRSKESGQTLLLVAVSLFALIAVAALAIDVTALYEARGEMQRTADAAALAGGKAFVESGTTTAPNDLNLQGLAQTIGNAYVTSVVQANKVAGSVPSIVGGAPVYDFSKLGNPQITVTLQRTDVPTFFAHIFGQRIATVGASATAEAYNPSLAPGGAGGMPPIAPSCVKPWMIANIDPYDHGAGPSKPFVNPDGSLANAAVGPYMGAGTGVIGEQITVPNIWAPILITPISTVGYLPAKLASASTICPSCAAGGSNFEQSVACCDTANTYSCPQTSNAFIDLLSEDLTDTLSGASCLLTQGVGGVGASTGDDTVNFGNFLATNGNDPIEITSGSGPHSGARVSTSSQIVTVPIIDVNILDLVTGEVKIVGFMQAFVEKTNASGAIVMDVLNISGCGTTVNTALPPISGGGASPVPVRLIHP